MSTRLGVFLLVLSVTSESEICLSDYVSNYFFKTYITETHSMSTLLVWSVSVVQITMTLYGDLYS